MADPIVTAATTTTPYDTATPTGTAATSGTTNPIVNPNPYGTNPATPTTPTTSPVTTTPTTTTPTTSPTTTTPQTTTPPVTVAPVVTPPATTPPAQVPPNNQQQIQQTQQQLTQAQAQLATLQSNGYSGDQTPQYDAQGNIINITPPSNLTASASTATGQAQWYSSSPDSFEAYAKANNLSDADIQNAKVGAAALQVQAEDDKVSKQISDAYAGLSLTDDQKNQLAGVQKMWDATVAAQQAANDSYISSAQGDAYKAGGEYNSTGVLAAAQRGIQTGIDRITQFQGEEQAALAALKDAFIANDVKSIQDQYAIAQDKEKSITDALNTAYANTVNAAKVANDLKEQQIKDKLAQDQQDQTKTYQDNMTAIEQSKANEQTRHDMMDELNARTTNDIKKFEDGITTDSHGNIILQDSTTGAALDPTQLPGVSKFGNGIYYFDPTTFANNTGAEKGAEAQAKRMGIPILSTDDVKNINNIQTALQNLQTAQDAFSKIATPQGGALGQSLKGAGTDLAGMWPIGYSTQYAQNIAAYNTARNSVISLGEGFGGNNARALRAIIQLMQDNKTLPEVGFGNLSTTNSANAEKGFDTARTMLYNGIKDNIIPNAVLPTTGYAIYTSPKDYSIDHPTVTIPADGSKLGNSTIYAGIAGQTLSSQTAYTTIWNNIAKANPTLSPQDVDQVAMAALNY